MSDLVHITEMAPQGMITLRADPTVSGPAVSSVLSLPMPETRCVTMSGARKLAWMSPDELMLLVPSSETADTIAGLRQALVGQHHLLQDVSDIRAMFSITGANARDVLAKLVPADLHPDSFGAGEMRRSRLAQIPCAFWLEDDGFRLLCFRSVAQYALDLLQEAALDDAPVGYFPAR